MKDRREALIVFARFPEPGRTKTRLIPLVGPERAVEAYRRVAEETARQVRRLERPGLERIVWIEPGSRMPEASRWLGPSFRYRPQPAGDLGVRLSAAFGEAFREGDEHVVAIGTDCPGLGAPLLDRAFDVVASGKAVLGPSEDGGYYLIGLPRPSPNVFREIPWSTSEVFRVTRGRLEGDGAEVAILETLRDLDTPDDFTALLRRWPELLGGL